jgi:hypothetical protein
MPGAKFRRLVAVLPCRMGMLNRRSCESWLLVALLVVSTTGASPDDGEGVGQAADS